MKYNLEFKKFPDVVPRHNEIIFILYDRFGCIENCSAKVEYTWYDDNGNQIIYTGKETSNKLVDLMKDRYKLGYMFFNEITGDLIDAQEFFWIEYINVEALFSKI